MKIDSGLELSRSGELVKIGMTSDFFAERYIKSYNKRRAPHCHDFCEIELVERGHGVCTVNGRRFEITRGDLFLIRPTDVHGYEIARGESLTVRTVRFFGEPGGELFCELTQPDILAARLCEDDTRKLISLTDDCMNELKSPDRYSPIILSGIVNRICTTLLRNLEPVQSDTSSPLAASAVALIKSEYKRRITVTSIAERLTVSPNHLGRCFKAEMGLSFHDYLLRMRLGSAASMLTSSKLSVKQIALECGFGSPSALSREFTAHYGIPPSEFRTRHGS